MATETAIVEKQARHLAVTYRRQDIHPTVFPLIQLSKEDMIYASKLGNFNMMKNENAADIADSLLGGKLDTSPNIPEGIDLVVNKMTLTITYARVRA